MSSSLTGTSGVYFVAACLNAIGLQCAPTFGSVPSVDILISNLDGSASLALQVKTTKYALRQKGRGDQKKPHHYEWDIGWKCAQLNTPNLFFALVDLKDSNELEGLIELPDIFIVPSSVIAEYFKAGPEGWPRARYHPLIEEIIFYKNNWQQLRSRLQELQRAA